MFSSWYLAPQDIINHELRDLMSQAIEIYLSPTTTAALGPNMETKKMPRPISHFPAGAVRTNDNSLEKAIAEIKEFTGLHKYRVTDIIRFFLSQCDVSNCLDKESFSILFRHLCGEKFVSHGPLYPLLDASAWYSLFVYPSRHLCFFPFFKYGIREREQNHYRYYELYRLFI